MALSVATAEEVRACASAKTVTFPLLPDPEHRVADLYGVTDDGLARRFTFVIDPAGVVRHVESDVFEIAAHGRDMLTVLLDLQRRSR